MEENPYRSPLHKSPTSRLHAGRRRPWLTSGAFGWLVFLFLYLPYPNVSRASPGAFLGFKVITTAISTVAVVILILVPRGWWKIVTILVAAVVATLVLSHD